MAETEKEGLEGEHVGTERERNESQRGWGSRQSCFCAAHLAAMTQAVARLLLGGAQRNCLQANSCYMGLGISFFQKGNAFHDLLQFPAESLLMYTYSWLLLFA